jgi:hypothetical protein
MEAILAVRPAPQAAFSALRSKAVWLVAAAAFGLEMAMSARYGYVRDELYFLAAGQHPALGYVDQPALTPLLARLDVLITGNTLVGLRALPALMMAALVLLTASMARVLGAGRRGQLIAAVATACCAQYLGAMHELTTAPADFVCWAALLLFAVKLLTSGDRRWWLAIGVTGGIGMSAKWNIGFLVAGLALGFVMSREARPLLRSRYLAIGAVLFAVLAAPDFIWQATHGWPNLAVFHALQHDAWKNRANYWPGQVLYTSIVLVPLWVRGLVWSLRDKKLKVLGIAAIAVIVAQFVLGGKAYYPGGIYTVLFAAGAVALAVDRDPAEPREPGESAAPAARRWRTLIAVYIVGAAISSVIALPVLPAAALARVPVQKINYDLGEEIGWPAQVSLVSQVWHALPASERSAATVLTGNYGEAGALDRYGPAFGLPQAYCGANSFWSWGPPPEGDTVAVVVGGRPAFLHRWFTSVRLAAVYHNGMNVSDDEEGTEIYVVSGLRTSWQTAWPAFRDYS